MAGRLTTHVLNTMLGTPAVGMKVDFYELTSDKPPRLLGTAMTNEDGRLDAPLVAEGQLCIGTYELSFHVGQYFRSQGVPLLPEPPFLDVVPIRFGIAKTGEHYHVPLLVSPWAYSTYRGS